MEGYRLFRRDRQGRRGRGGHDGGVALCIMQGLECVELSFGNGPVENLWISIKGLANSANFLRGVCYGSLRQADSTDKLLFKELRDT